MVTVGGPKIDRDLEIGESGVGFAGEAVEGGKSVVNVIGFRGKFAGFLETFAGFVPATEIHHGYTALIMILGRFGILVSSGLHALFGDAEMGAGAVGQFPAGTGNDLFEFLFGALELLLVKQSHRFFVEFHLGLDQRVDQFDTTALRGSLS